MSIVREGGEAVLSGGQGISGKIACWPDELIAPHHGLGFLPLLCHNSGKQTLSLRKLGRLFGFFRAALPLPQVIHPQLGRVAYAPTVFLWGKYRITRSPRKADIALQSHRWIFGE